MLEDQCDYGIYFDKCGNETNFCFAAATRCNGIANCPNGEDEELSMCEAEGIFSPLATIDCIRIDTYNIEVKTKAIKCDGKAECASHEDEENCSLPDYILFVILVTVIAVSTLSTWLMWLLMIKDLERLKESETTFEKDFNDFKIHHGTSVMMTKMQQIQASESSKTVNTWFINMELEYHNQQQNEVICCIKVDIEHNFK